MCWFNLRTILLAGVFAILSTVASGEAVSASDRLTSTFKNVILMIPDGCGIAHFTLARWYKGTPLACDALNVALVRTYCSNSYITDSAPAATAYATGYKSENNYISVLPAVYAMPGITLPAGKENMPVATVLEGARLSGRATGVVATSMTSHATPAAFTSHWYARSNEAILMEQQVYQGVDVLLGGGRKQVMTPVDSGVRPDNENLLDTLKARGYSILTTREELAALPSHTGKVWGQFNLDALSRDFDRSLPVYQHQPSLADMTQKAITLLSNSKAGQSKGFFLMVEGSQVDWASHANEPVGVLSEYLAFDSAVAVAKNFTETNGKTLLLVLSDHDNGGLSLGGSRTNSTYSIRPLDSLLTAPLRKATLTGAGIKLLLGDDRSSNAIIHALGTYFGITDLTPDEISTVTAASAGRMEHVLGTLMSKRTDISWTTTGHTGNDVPLYYLGTNDQLKILQNTDVARICAKAMKVDLDKVTDSLFRRADKLFGNATSMTVDTVGFNNASGSLTVVMNGKTAIFPFNKNELIVDGNKHLMNGLTVYSFQNNTVYVPAQALSILKGISGRLKKK